jgi:glycosyltransferase involved in cell wall biosynthesis
MKIAFVNQPWDNVIPPVQGGSLAIWTYQVARRCTPFCDIIVYARRGPGQLSEQWHEEIQYRRVAVSLEDQWLKGLKLIERLFGYPRPRRPLFSTPSYYFGYIWQIAHDLRRQRCDIVHIHNFSQFVPIIRAYNPKIKIVLHMNCDWLAQLDPAVIDRRLRQTDLILGCSEYITENIRRHHPRHADKCRVVFNGADLVPFVSAVNGSSPAQPAAGKRILYVGRISPEKGVHTLLEAFGIVTRQCPQTQLDLIGHVASAPYEFMVLVSDDPKVADLRRFYEGRFYRSDYGAALRQHIPPEEAERVHFLGQVAHQQIMHHYQQADLVVIPSFTEAFPLTLVEAMASGKAVVVSRVGGMQEMVQENLTGKFVPAGEPVALAEAILELLADDARRQAMGQAGRAQVSGRFQWDAIAQSLLAAYSEIPGNDHA